MANSRETIKRRYERNLIIWNSKWEFIQMVCIFWLRILVVFQRTKHSIHSRAQRIYRSNILGKIIETNGNTTANANAQKWQKTNCDDNINESRKNVVKVVKQNQTGNGAMQKCHFWAFVAFFFFCFSGVGSNEHFTTNIFATTLPSKKKCNRLKHSVVTIFLYMYTDALLWFLLWLQ